MHLAKSRGISSVSPPVSTELTPAWCYMAGGHYSVKLPPATRQHCPLRRACPQLYGLDIHHLNVCANNLGLLRSHNKTNHIHNDDNKNWMENFMRLYWGDAVLIVGAVSDTVLKSVIYGNDCWQYGQPTVIYKLVDQYGNILLWSG